MPTQISTTLGVDHFMAFSFNGYNKSVAHSAAKGNSSLNKDIIREALWIELP
jgi:hypothetical protein